MNELTHLSLFSGIGGLDLATFAKLIPTVTTKRSMEKGLFEVKVTGTGQVYFVDTFLRKGGEE